MPRPDTLPAWQQLAELASKSVPGVSQCFAADPERASRLSAEAAGLFVDYSKQTINAEILASLLQLAEQADVQGWIERLFAGDRVNNTEDRPALHMALRQEPQTPFPSKEHNLMPEVSGGLKAMAEFCANVSEGRWSGTGGQRITDVVNLGIGGSDLGPRMLVKALAPYASNEIDVHFVGNGDGGELHEVLCSLNPETTLFLVVSKSFSTAETLKNARQAREWLLEASPEASVAQHFVAISAQVERAESFGAGLVLPFWNWVGGRYSVWSTVGTSLALAIGISAFEEFLAGAREMDEHFREAPLNENLPAILGLLGIWHSNFLGVNQHVVLPYSQYLEALPAYLQQLEMESNGKGVDREGRPVTYATVPAIWGEVGTNAQHAFMQRLHQGPENVPVEFVLPLRVRQPYHSMHDSLVANCLAQSEALMCGRSADDFEPGTENLEHRELPGNRPSTTIVLPELSPRNMGALLALYEHKVFVQSVIWNINPFDQWGVEEGKRLANSLLREIESGKPGDHDASTLNLLQRYIRQRNS